ncbi:MAG: hypothetical protein ACYDEQ_05215 [Desulfocucumaceae bacterium]
MNQYTNQSDYRVNTRDNSNISVEIKCCGQHIGEMRFKDGQSMDCPHCGIRHLLRIEHNHFHLTHMTPE